MAAASLPPPPRRLSVRISARLAAAALIAVIIEIAIVFAFYNADPERLAEQLLTIQAERIASKIAASDGDFSRLSTLPLPRGAVDWAYAVYDAPGRRLFQHLPKSSTTLPLPEPAGFAATRHVAIGWEKVAGIRQVSAGKLKFWIAISVSGRGRTLFTSVYLTEALAHVVLPVVPLTLLLLIVNIIIVRRMLMALSCAAAEADALGPARLDARLTEPETDDEVRALVAAVNRALDRLQFAMVTLETFTADAAHELRTPLAVHRLRLDRLEPGPLKEQLCTDVATMTRLVNQMLELAQADALEVGTGETINLASLARDVMASRVPMAQARDADLALFEHGSAEVRGHREALFRAVGNLVDNAVAHSPAGAAIDVVVGPGPSITVRDRGPGLTDAVAGQLFRRFWRGPGRGHPGAGLGLAIVQSILTKHGATISASNAEGGGAVFTCSWPNKGVD